MPKRARFKIDGTTYNVPNLDTISLKDMLVFERETRDFGLPMKWSEIEVLANEDSDGEPELMLMAAMVWLARREAGEQVTFDQAVDFPISSMEFLKEPEDHAPKASKKSPSRRASAAAAVSPEDEHEPSSTTAKKTSSRQSATA